MSDPTEKPEPPDSTKSAGTVDGSDTGGHPSLELVPRAGLVEEALSAAGYGMKLKKVVHGILQRELFDIYDRVEAQLDAEEVQADLRGAFLLAARGGGVGASGAGNPSDGRFSGSEISVLLRATEFIEGSEVVRAIIRSLENTLAGPVAVAAATAYDAVVEGPLDFAVSKSIKAVGVAPGDSAVEQRADQAYRTHLRRIEALPAEALIDNARRSLEELQIKAESGCRQSVQELRNIGIKVASMLESCASLSGDESSLGKEDAFCADRKRAASEVVRDVARNSEWWPLAVPAIVDGRKALVEERVIALALGEDLPFSARPKKSGRGAGRKFAEGSTKGFVLKLYQAVEMRRGRGISDDHRRELEEEDKNQSKGPEVPLELRRLKKSKPNDESWTDAEKEQWNCWVDSAAPRWERRWICKAQLLPEMTKASRSQWVSAMIAFLEAETWGDLEAIHWPSEIKKRAEEVTSDGTTRGFHSAAKEILKRELGELASR